jgi:hypothetical protein
MSSGGHAGTPIANPFFNFNQYGISPRRGQVTIIAGAPGAGKSALMSHITVHARPKIPAIFFSADTDMMTLGVRVAASVIDRPLHEVDDLIREGDEGTWSAVEGATDHIWYCWDSAPGCWDIEQEVLAYTIVTGAFPHLIVVDNLINVDSEGQSADYKTRDGQIAWLQDLARITNAAVVILHHVTGQYEDGLTPIPLSGLLDKVGKRPRLVLTLYKVTDSLLGVRVVKNSSGKAATDASYGPDIAWMPEKSWMKG